jgi:hypothetical protein
MPFSPGRIVATTYWILVKNHALLDGLVVATTRCILTRNCTHLACWVNNGFHRVGVDLLACDMWASSNVYRSQNSVQIISSPHPRPTDWKVYCDNTLSSSPNCVSLGWTSTYTGTMVQIQIFLRSHQPWWISDPRSKSGSLSPNLTSSGVKMATKIIKGLAQEGESTNLGACSLWPCDNSPVSTK